MRSWFFCVALLLVCGSCGTSAGFQATEYSPSAVGQKQPQPGKWNVVGYHRYRGWLGNEPIAMELLFSPRLFGQGLQCNGSYYYERHGGAIEVLGQRLMESENSPKTLVFRPERPLFLSTWDDFAEQWQAVQVAGPVLRGLWTSRFGFVQQDFVLVEDYANAVRYEIANAQAYTVCTPYDEATGVSYSDTSCISRDYLHLLGPDTLLPALRRLQCPGPARRQAEIQALVHDVNNECTELYEDAHVLFNGCGLLTMGRYASEESHLQAHPSHSRHTSVFHLPTGRALRLQDLLDPGTELPLRQLLARNVIQALGRTPPSIGHDKNGIEVAPLPEGGVGVLSDGLLFAYGDDELVGYAGGMPSVVIPYSELLHLLRPSSPLTPLLRARGLHPKR